MKKLLISMAIIVSIVMSSSAVFAGSGTAVIPHFYGYTINDDDQHPVQVFMSNISDKTITVNITFFKSDGTILQEGSAGDLGAGVGILKAYNTSGTYNENLNSSTAPTFSFDIDANETSYVRLDIGSTIKYGYGLIEWNNETATTITPNSPALVAHCRIQQYNTDSRDISTTENWAYVGWYSVPINNGLPF